MSGHWPVDPAAPLRAFGDALGIPVETWPAREELEQLTYSDSNLERAVASRLTLERITSLIEAYGEALTCRFLLDDLPVLEVASGLSEADLERFRADTRHSPTVTLDLKLDKARLIEKWLGRNWRNELPGCQAFLYLYAEALESFMIGPLRELERCLWGEETAQKVILLVPGREIRLNGPYLAVVGGAWINKLREVVLEELPDAKRVQVMYRTCREILKWEESWLHHLTPLHLKVGGQAPPGDVITGALLAHLDNLAILYTADRTTLQANRRWVATYIGASQSVEVVLGDPPQHWDEGVWASINSLIRLVEWAYDSRWSADRLPLVQVAVVQALRAAAPTVRYRLLLDNATCIFEGLQWHWKAFIENKVDAYTAQVRELEDYVADTMQAFADQSSAMVKSLSETMLAAVAALLGSFVAALFKDEFNPLIFRIGMVAYAAYVFVFPLIYTMSHQWGWYRMLVKEFAGRRQRFEERMYRDRVEEMVGTQFDDSRSRFKRWFIAILLTYLAVVVLAIFLASSVPGAIGGLVPSPSPIPTPTAATFLIP